MIMKYYNYENVKNENSNYRKGRPSKLMYIL